MVTSNSDAITAAVGPEAREGALVLLVGYGGLVSRHPLEGPGPLSIGRSRGNQVVIDHPSVSRVHAVLTLDPITIEDKASANGTRLRGERLAAGVAARLDVGELATLGEVVVLLQRVAGTAPAAAKQDRSLEGRLGEECARSARSGAPFCHARVHAVRPADRERVGEILAGSLRSADVVGESAPGQLQALLVDVGAAEARTVIDRVRARCEQAGLEVRVGMACYPGEGTTAEQLSGLAWERATTAPGLGPTAMDRVRELIQQVAPATISVLIRGETGTGKELCAEMLHRLSPRAQKPLTRVNCAAFTETLLESELFGHEKGAFTGAQSAKVGLIEATSGGTLFLDEIGELSPGMQSKLLRVLESRELRRVGGLESRPVDVRFVAATHRALQDDIEKGRFRQDLFFRLSGVTISLPPLRMRPEAIEGLAHAFLARACHQARRPTIGFSAEALATLREHPFPGNVRELRNAVERAMLFAGDGLIDVRHLGLALGDDAEPSPTLLPRSRPAATPSPDRAATIPPAAPPSPTALHDEVARLEKERILQALADCGGNQTRAARLLGIARGTLQSRMDAFGITRPRK